MCLASCQQLTPKTMTIKFNKRAYLKLAIVAIMLDSTLESHLITSSEFFRARPQEKLAQVRF